MQKAFFRNIVAAVVAVIILLRSGKEISCRKKPADPADAQHLGTIGILANFWAVDHRGIADANMLNKLSPFFAILMSIFILGEKPNRIEWISVVLAFIGAAFVAKPSSGIISLPGSHRNPGRPSPGTAYTYVRRAGLQGVRGPIVVAFFSIFSTLVLLAEPADELHAHERGTVHLPDSGRLLRRGRPAFDHSGLSACARAGYLRV